MIEKGWNTDAACVYQVSVFAGDSKQPCGTFTLKRGSYFNQVITMLWITLNLWRGHINSYTCDQYQPITALYLLYHFIFIV